MDDLGHEKAGLGGMVAGDLEWRRGRQAGQRIHMASSPVFLEVPLATGERRTDSHHGSILEHCCCDGGVWIYWCPVPRQEVGPGRDSG